MTAPRTPAPQDAPSARAGRGARAYLVLLACVVLPYANAIPNGFVWDDVEQLDVHGRAALDLAALFTRPSWGALRPDEVGGSPGSAIATYRPLLLLSFVLDAALWGDRAFGYHLTNVALFAALGLALLAVLRTLLPSPGAALAITAFYCTQPFMTETVSWISGRHDLLMTLCLVVELLCLCRAARTSSRARGGYVAGALAAFVCALWSKEPALAFPIPLAALLWLSPLRDAFSTRSRVGLLSAHVLLGALYLAVRSEIVARGNLVGGAGGALAALEVAPLVATRYVGYFAYLPHLSSHYLQPHPGGFSFAAFTLPALLHAAALGAAFWLRKRWWGLPVGLLAYYALLAPAAVMIANKPEHSHRFLFAPSLGLVAVAATLAAMVYGAASPRLRTLATVALALAIAVQALRIVDRNRDYQSDYAFYSSLVRDEPGSPLGYYGLGIWLQRHGRMREAEAAYLLALERAPSMAQIYNNLGVLHLASGEPARSEAVLAVAVTRWPDSAKLHYNLGLARAQLGQAEAAERALERAIELDPGYQKAYRALYDLYRATDPPRAAAFRARHASRL